MKSLLCYALLALLALGILPQGLQGQIESGAAIKITILGVPITEQGQINSAYPVSETGHITMPHIGTLRAAGMRPADLARKIETAYREAEIYTHPVIQVIADSSDVLTQQLITVGGKVRAPGPKPYQKGMTLYQAVMAAGGPTEFGAVNRVKLYRNGKAYTYDLTQGAHKLLKVFARDTIDVQQKNWIGR